MSTFSSIYAAKDNQQALEFENLALRLARYSLAHKRTLNIIEFLQSKINQQVFVGEQLYQAKTLLRHISGCGHWLIFANYAGVAGIKLQNANFCKKHIVCPLCAARRSSVLIDRYSQRYQQIINPESGYFNLKGNFCNPSLDKKLVPYMLTLTVRNSNALSAGFKRLKTAFAAMKEQRRLYRCSKTRHKYSQLAGLEAMFYSYEITKNKKTGWHPHVHCFCLFEAGKEPDFPIGGSAIQKKRSGLAREWFHYTGDSYIVDLRDIKNVEKAFQEVLKYFVKFGDLTLEENFEVFCELGGQRFVGALGHFHGVRDLSDDELALRDLSQLDFEEYFFKYFAGRYRQVPYVDGLSEFYESDRQKEYAIYDEIDKKIILGEFPSDFWEIQCGIVRLDDDEIPF